MKKYIEFSKEELKKEYDDLLKEYNTYKGMGLKLDMSRGKPCKEQLDLSMDLMSVIDKNSNLICKDGTDCRNYGQLGGIEEARELLASFMENDIKNILIYGNSSLNVMYNTIMQAWIFGILGNTPWGKLPEIKFLCPVPGYDRHFAICEEFGIKMINVPMHEDGPDMDMVESLIKDDDSIKGIWCVPKYSNPDGYTYSDEVVKRFARLKPKAPDFRIFWDNAYTVHHLYDDPKYQDYIIEILAECERAGNPDIVYKFGSTSKICFPGSGIASIAASDNNVADIKKHLKVQTIGYDKVNELRHVRYFRNLLGIKSHMVEHAKILRPKFELVIDELNKNLGELDIARWTNPRGGYFISFYAMKGTAKEIVSLCKDAGVKLTDAGATYPYHNDPDDSNIRIAPTYPSLTELANAIKVFICCVKLTSVKALL